MTPINLIRAFKKAKIDAVLVAEGFFLKIYASKKNHERIKDIMYRESDVGVGYIIKDVRYLNCRGLIIAEAVDYYINKKIIVEPRNKFCKFLIRLLSKR